MAPIEWNETYSVGIREFDDQHRVIVDLINMLQEAREKGRERETLSIVLHSLMGYAASHFAAEEKLMAETDYPDLQRHRAAHNDFVRRVSDFREEHRESRAALPAELMHFLNEWWMGHILVVDKQYTAHLKERGYS